MNLQESKKNTNGRYTDFDEYIRQGEPGKIEKTIAWKTAIGLQDVDGLKTSDYLLETAKDHIEGKIDIQTASRRIEGYYEERTVRNEIEEETREADIVSSRITAILGEKTFQFSPVEWKNIHKRLFTGVFEHAGTFRPYNITKKEWVLNGESVYYASADSLQETLEYDFRIEKEFSYAGLTAEEFVRHVTKFTSGIWQIHPFCEGNTRSTAVFIIKYLKSFGYSVTNGIFADHSWYFRNALVRANYNDHKNGINATTVFLERFFENLLLGYHNELKNRYLHVDYRENESAQSADQSANDDISKCKTCTFEEMAILQEMKKNPAVTQKQLSEIIGKSERTIKTRTVEMQEKELIRRENGKRSGKWEILVEI